MNTPTFVFQWRQWLSKGHRAAWVIFALFAFLIFIQNLLFNYFAFHYRMEQAVEYDSMLFWVGSILIKLSLAIVFASFTFLLRDKRWIIVLSVLIDTWIVANLIYMRNNYIMLDAEAFNQSANLHGYWLSTLIYIEWGTDLFFYLLTALVSCVFFFTDRSPRSWLRFVIVLGIGLCIHMIGDACHDALGQNTFRRDQRESVYGTNFSKTVAQTSLLEAPTYIVSDYEQLMKNELPSHPMTHADSVAIHPYTIGDPDLVTDEPLIIILLESLENWVCRPDVMPNLWKLTQSNHVLYADHIHTQIVGAPSADGQMIVNTGLLPISAGATCLHYSKNEFPALMKLTEEPTILLLPHDTCVWNQKEMSPAFGYDSTIVFSDVDTLLFPKLCELIDHGYRHIQCITQSTHAPFINERYSNLEMPMDMPWVMHNYIRGFNALDNGLRFFIHKLETDPQLQHYTIVITGDHRILHREKREQMLKFTTTHHLNYKVDNDCLPLIIYSPHIQGNHHVTRDAYQMDIYPTILSLIGATQYSWKGFGINLLEPHLNTIQRPFTPQEAHELSDRLIRNNYFQR